MGRGNLETYPTLLIKETLKWIFVTGSCHDISIRFLASAFKVLVKQTGCQCADFNSSWLLWMYFMFFSKLSNIVTQPSKFRQMLPIIAGLQNAIRYIVAQLLLVSVMAGKVKSYTLDRCHCCVIMVKFQPSPACFIRISGCALWDFLRE